MKKMDINNGHQVKKETMDINNGHQVKKETMMDVETVTWHGDDCKWLMVCEVRQQASCVTDGLCVTQQSRDACKKSWSRDACQRSWRRGLMSVHKGRMAVWELCEQFSNSQLDWEGRVPGYQQLRGVKPELRGVRRAPTHMTGACRWGKTCDIGTVPRSELEGDAETLACRWGQTWRVQKFQKRKRKKEREWMRK